MKLKSRKLLFSNFIIVFLSIFAFGIFLLFLSGNQIYNNKFAFGITDHKPQITLISNENVPYGPETMWDHGKNDSEYMPSSECHKDLTGRWIGNDGGKYYMRQIGNYVWWIGSDKFNSGEGFTNVFHGYRTDTNNKVLWGSWQDVPLGTTSGDGFLTLYIAQSGTKIFRYGAEASDSGSPFGGSEWTKNDNRDPLCMGVLGGSSTGSAGGFIQMFPTSPSK